MKRTSYFMIVLVVLMSLALAACQPAATQSPADGASGVTTILRVATEASYPPFEMVDPDNGELIGFDIELMKAIAEKAGFEIEFLNTPFDPLLAGMAQCQFDAAVSAITITEERAKEMDFSDPYINAGQIIAVQINNTDITSVDDLKGKNVGVQLGTTGQIQAEKIEGANIKAYDTADLAFLDLANGQLDGVIVDYPTTLNYVNQFSDKIKTTGEIFTDESYGIAVCKGNTELLGKINAALAELKADGTLAELESKWLASALNE